MKQLLLLLSTTLVPALAACSTVPDPELRLTESGTGYSIAFTDRMSAATLEIGGVSDTVEGDLKVAQVEILNTAQGPFPLKARCIWLDAYGMAIRSPATAAALFTIDPGSTLWYRSVAPSPKAESFRLELSSHN